MNSAWQTILIVLIVLFLVPAVPLLRQQVRLVRGRRRARKRAEAMKIEPLGSFGSVPQLSILPLSDYYSDNPDLRTEAGVAYLLRAGDQTILFDTGFNPDREHPSPLLANMRALGLDEGELDMIYISHRHLDHVGGREEARTGTFSLSAGPVELSSIPVHAPVPLTPSAHNPGPKVIAQPLPRVLGEGLASTGVIPRCLFLAGETDEQSLAVNVAGKGIVLIIGCGHQGVEQIITRARLLFQEPLYALVGGLHCPVTGGRIYRGPFNIQKLVASDRLPFGGLRPRDVEESIKAAREAGVREVALSAHDSCDWSIERFARAFGPGYHPLKVGQEILF